MMKKKGFTLVELIAVIAILSIILLISVPALVNNIQSKKANASEKIYKLIETAAQNYIIDYSIDDVVSIPLSDLCGRYLECPIIDPYTGEEIEGYIAANEDGSYSITGEVKLSRVLNGGNTTQSFKNSYPPYTNIILIPPTKENYDFSGWEVTSGNGKINGNNLTIGNRDTTIYAKWKAYSSLTVDLNEGTSSQSFKSTYSSGTTFVLIEPTREGYTFSGWELVTGDSIISGNNFTMGSTNTTIKAKWAINTYTITYNLNGGKKGTNSPVKETYGSIVTVDNPTKIGHTFNEWTVSGTGASMSGTSLTIGAGNITLTANWIVNTYTITYNLNGGTAGSNAPTSGTYGSTVMVDIPTKEGYIFNGWTVSGRGSIMSGNNLTIGAGDVTLTANWELGDTIAPTCTLTATEGSTTITATVSDEGGSGIAGKGFSTSYGGETTTTISTTETITYYVKDVAGNTGTCSATISETTKSSCQCSCGFPHAGACYYYDSSKNDYQYCGQCSYSYICDTGTKINDSYCFNAN